MVLEINTAKEDLNPLSSLDMHIVFGTSHNHQCKCPYCGEIAIIILQTQMLVGDQFALDYSKNNDFSKNKNTFGSMSNGTTNQFDVMQFDESDT